MNPANVPALGKRERVQLDARSDPLLELDAEALAEVWAAACDDDGADCSALCSSRRRTWAPPDADE